MESERLEKINRVNYSINNPIVNSAEQLSTLINKNQEYYPISIKKHTLDNLISKDVESKN
ncbi:MAG: hypothetical protein IAX22_00900 [Candidatus Bathyarchaeota archaeon]|nr:hypothetical protein [Candidatus Bathyarchaeota archaeon]